MHAYFLVQIFRRLRAVGPNVTLPLTCLRREYVQGRCLLSVQAGTDFKVGRHGQGRCSSTHAGRSFIA